MKASVEIIEEAFASSWIYRLVPPNTISSQAKCRHGVANVETHHTFVNQLVSFITLGICSPMNIKVTCAASGSAMIDGNSPDLILAENATEAEVQAHLSRAADRAVAENKPIYVR